MYRTCNHANNQSIYQFIIRFIVISINESINQSINQSSVNTICRRRRRIARGRIVLLAASFPSSSRLWRRNLTSAKTPNNSAPSPAAAPPSTNPRRLEGGRGTDIGAGTDGRMDGQIQIQRDGRTDGERQT